MTTAATMVTEERVWGVFEAYRERLFDQYERVDWRDEPGALSPEELEAEARRILATDPSLPRVLQKARIYELIVSRGQISMEPWDWFPSKLNHGDLLTRLRAEWQAELEAGPLAEDAAWFQQASRVGLGIARLDLGHISPGWENMFAAGLAGLLAQVGQVREEAADATKEQLAFWNAVELVYRATIGLYRRFAELAERLALEHPEYAGRMHQVAAACRSVPARRPVSFHESLLFAFLMHELIEMEGELVRSMGHLDRVWYPYYRADQESGALAPAQAKELLQFLWMKYYSRTRGKRNGKNFLLGGQDATGRPIENELTYLALEAYEELGTPDPKLSVRFMPGLSDRLYRRVADLIRRGHNSFVLMNDAPSVAALVRRGKPIEDARIYLPIGCYEPAVDGKETGCTMNMTINLAKGVEYALHDGRDVLSGEQVGVHTGDPRGFVGYTDCQNAVLAQIDHFLSRTMSAIRAHERYWPEINPSPLVAGTIGDCIARGKDIGQGGPFYNGTGCVAMSLANTADALQALRQAVYEEGRLSIAEMVDALDADFSGNEALRMYLLHRVPKWGNGDDNVDALARQLADHWCDSVHALVNHRGGSCQAGLFSLQYQWTLGQRTAATPDGRHARTTLAPGVGPTTGCDRNGVTGTIASVTRLDFERTPNGAVLDLTLHASAVSGDDGLEAFVQLIKTFFAGGGYALQFNVLDGETLREAQRHPEDYRTLQIRVTGWSVYFTELSRFEQDQFIARNAHML